MNMDNFYSKKNSSKLKRKHVKKSVKTTVKKLSLKQHDLLMKNFMKGIKCKVCYDKGYSTELVGDTMCYADFIGDKTFKVRGARIVVKLCNCGRGKDLAMFFDIKKQYKR